MPSKMIQILSCLENCDVRHEAQKIVYPGNSRMETRKSETAKLIKKMFILVLRSCRLDRNTTHVNKLPTNIANTCTLYTMRNDISMAFLHSLVTLAFEFALIATMINRSKLFIALVRRCRLVLEVTIDAVNKSLTSGKVISTFFFAMLSLHLRRSLIQIGKPFKCRFHDSSRIQTGI